jgi:hypothetical protein
MHALIFIFIFLKKKIRHISNGSTYNKIVKKKNRTNKLKNHINFLDWLFLSLSLFP